MTKLHSTLTAVALAAGFAAADDKATKADDKAGKLVGTYTITSGERDGKALPKTDFDGSIVKFTDTAVVGTDKDKMEFFAATYTLDTSKTPWAISMTTTAHLDTKDKEPKKDPAEKPKDEKMTANGLVKVDGDTVTIVYALPGGKDPTDFKTGEKQQLFVLKRTVEKKEK